MSLSLIAVSAMIAMPAALHAATLLSTVSAQITANYTASNALGYTVVDLSRTADIMLDAGTGNNQANTMFADTRTLTASSSENLDLAGGLTDPLGGTLTF